MKTFKTTLVFGMLSTSYRIILMDALFCDGSSLIFRHPSQVFRRKNWQACDQTSFTVRCGVTICRPDKVFGGAVLFPYWEKGVCYD
jgi:hypothetical protein